MIIGDVAINGLFRVLRLSGNLGAEVALKVER